MNHVYALEFHVLVQSHQVIHLIVGKIQVFVHKDTSCVHGTAKQHDIEL